MQRDIIVVDNFYKNPEAVIAYAKKQRYYYPYQDGDMVKSGVQKPSWMSSEFKPKAECPFRSSKKLIETFEKLTGDKIEQAYWNRELVFENDHERADFYKHFATKKFDIQRSYEAFPQGLIPSDFEVSLWNCAFQLKTKWDTSQAIHHHIDDYWQCCGELGWNGIVYLNKNAPIRGGFQTWHNKYGNDREWMTEHERWELIDDMGNIFNRLILFRGKTPHSGAPGFGETFDDGRLFQTFFFRTVNPETNDSFEFVE